MKGTEKVIVMENVVKNYDLIKDVIESTGFFSSRFSYKRSDVPIPNKEQICTYYFWRVFKNKWRCNKTWQLHTL